jgi:transcriptional regulator with XRE-family HTH domain
MGASAEGLRMRGQKSKFDEFLEDESRRRLYERESLAFEAMELVSRLMAQKGVSRAELARRIGKSKAFVTQLLSGSRNMTMHTLADLVFALGHWVELEAHPCDQTVEQEERAASLPADAGKGSYSGKPRWGDGVDHRARSPRASRLIGS